MRPISADSELRILFAFGGFSFIPSIIAAEGSQDFLWNVTKNAHHPCWDYGQMVTPQLCCAGDEGLSSCFIGRFTYESCCQKLGFDPNVALPKLPESRWVPPSRPLDLHVDILIPALPDDVPMLELLLESLARHWPFRELSTEVVVLVSQQRKETSRTYLYTGNVRQCILSATDVCSQIMRQQYPWVVCKIVEAPSDAILAYAAGDVPLLFNADAYTSGTYIAIIETDSILFAPDIVPLLFDNKQRPIIKGSWTNYGTFSPAVLGFPYGGNLLDCEQMPFVVHRSHLAGLRAFIVSKMGKETFEDALLEFGRVVNEKSKYFAWWNPFAKEFGEPLGFLNTLGHYLFYFHEAEYAWSVRGGAILGWPLRYTCPSLHGFVHFGVPGSSNRKLRTGWPNEFYRVRASQFLLAGSCLQVHLPECEYVSVNLTELLIAGFPSASKTERNIRIWFHVGSVLVSIPVIILGVFYAVRPMASRKTYKQPHGSPIKESRIYLVQAPVDISTDNGRLHLWLLSIRHWPQLLLQPLCVLVHVFPSRGTELRLGWHQYCRLSAT